MSEGSVIEAAQPAPVGPDPGVEAATEPAPAPVTPWTDAKSKEDDWMTRPRRELKPKKVIPEDPRPAPGDPDFDLCTYRWSTFDPAAGAAIDAGTVPKAYTGTLPQEIKEGKGQERDRGSVLGINLNARMHKPVWEPKREGDALLHDPKQAWSMAEGEVGANSITWNNTNLALSDPWVVPKKMQCTVFMSGTDLDFRRARFVYPEVEVSASQYFGAVAIHVPRGVKVVSKGMGIFGTHTAGTSDTSHLDDAETGPTVVLKGFSVFGTAITRVCDKCPPIRIIPPERPAADLEAAGYLEVAAASPDAAAPAVEEDKEY